MSAHSSGISVVYLTHRETPRFDWFADSLARQAGDDELEVIVVDSLHAAGRDEQFEHVAGGRFPLRYVPAKPTPYNGARRRTKADYFAAASSRNTGIVYAAKPYVVFCDDLSVPMPGWWEEVRAAAGEESIAAGAYQKHWEMAVDGGMLVSSRCERSGIDSRWPQGDDRQPVRIGGGQLFGCSFGAPRRLLLDVNGCDEICDSIGGEDWQLGVRLERAGAPLYYRRRMLTIESEEMHRTDKPFLRVDRTTDPDTYMRRLESFGVERRVVDGAWDSSHMILDLAFGSASSGAMWNYYRLADLDEANLPDIEAHFPTEHWFDGLPLSEL